jgi:hypothetical protein
MNGIFVKELWAYVLNEYYFSGNKIKLFMTNTEQIKGIVERLGALRRYL